jgi:hypothetical protein
MQRITIGRYRTIPDDIPRPENFIPAQDAYAGYIEGVRDDGTEWVMFLDQDGSPAVYWGRRGDGGEVIGEPVLLADNPTLAGPQ